MKIFGKELSCDKCGVSCGGVGEPGLYKAEERWLCKRHYDDWNEYQRRKERGLDEGVVD